MAKKGLYIHIRFAWWFPYYAAALVFMCKLFGTMPDDEKLKKVIKFAMKKPILDGEEPKSKISA